MSAVMRRGLNGKYGITKELFELAMPMLYLLEYF
jgi:hypothetical protein